MFYAGAKLSPIPFEEFAVEAALGAPAQVVVDLAFGLGQRYEVTAGQLSVEVFPASRLSRITTPTSRLELFGAPPPRVVDGQIVFARETAHEDVSLSVSPEGTVVFGYVSCPTAPDQSTTAPETAQEPTLNRPGFGRDSSP